MFANLTFRTWLIESEAIYSKRLKQANSGLWSALNCQHSKSMAAP